MESLAVLVAILFLTAILSGPIVILLARIKFHSIVAQIIKRIIQGVLTLIGVIAGGQFLFAPGLPVSVRLIGIASITMCYIGVRKEYFPQFRLLSSILPSRSNGRSNGDDGNGPGSQH
jgi:hypothetical protein